MGQPGTLKGADGWVRVVCVRAIAWVASMVHMWWPGARLPCLGLRAWRPDARWWCSSWRPCGGRWRHGARWGVGVGQPGKGVNCGAVHRTRDLSAVYGMWGSILRRVDSINEGGNGGARMVVCKDKERPPFCLWGFCLWGFCLWAEVLPGPPGPSKVTAGRRLPRPTTWPEGELLLAARAAVTGQRTLAGHE